MDINTIASMAGVSRTTVSRYLNDGPVSEEKRTAIARVIKETGYVPSQHAKTLRTGKTGLVGVIIPKINSVSVSRMVSGLADPLARGGYQPLLANTNNDVKLEVDYLQVFAHQTRVDGVILIGTTFDASHERAIAKLGVPLVVLGQRLAGASCVYQDDYHASLEMTRRALAHGSSPAFIGVFEQDEAAGHQRRRGFVDACAEAGIAASAAPQLVADFNPDAGYLACEQLLDHKPDVDTIVCATDSIAFGALTCLREYGHRVPEDVQVTGVGDSDFSRLITPTVTTVHYHYKTAGEEAARMLVQAMAKPDGIPRELLMGYEVMVRNSTR